MRKSIPMFDSSTTPARRPRASSQTHRNEFPAGYSLASCSPAELASAFPTNVILQQSRLSVEQTSADCSCLSSVLSQKGPQSTNPFPQTAKARLIDRSKCGTAATRPPGGGARLGEKRAGTSRGVRDVRLARENRNFGTSCQ